MNDDFKKLVEQLRQQQDAGGFQVVDDVPSVEEQARMEPPRPDYSQAISDKPRYPKVVEHIRNLNNKIEVDPNFKPTPRDIDVYPSEEQLSQREKSMNAIQGSLHGNDFNTIKQIENLKKALGSK